MGATVAADFVVDVNNSDDIVTARQAGHELARQLGFSLTDVTMIATAISEIARNITSYAGRGEVRVGIQYRDGRQALVVRAEDDGPGIVDIDRALEDGYSTGRGLGLGLPGARRLMDRLVVESSPGKGTIVELEGLMTSTPGRDRHSGFREGLAAANAPELKVAFEADMAWLEPNARREMDSALAAHKKIDLVYAHNDPGAHGAYLAAKAAGREREMKFVGIDALPHEGVQYVKEGILDATFMYPTGGAEAIDAARKLLKGESVPKNITLGTKIFTKENVGRGGEEIK